jgi:hypothetical protein
LSYGKFIDKEIQDLFPSIKITRLELRRIRENKHRKNRGDLDPLRNIISLIKPVTMRRVGHVTRMGEMTNTYNILAEKPERKT